MSTTIEKPLTRVGMLRKHGISLPMTCAIDFANAYPGPIKDGAFPRRYMLLLSRRKWIAPISRPADMSELPDYEITPAGAAACKKIGEAETEFQQQRKSNGRRAKPVSTP